MCDRNYTTDSIGYAGGIILSICLIPQILKIYKTTDNRPDLSEFKSTLKSPSGEPIVGSGNFTVKK